MSLWGSHVAVDDGRRPSHASGPLRALQWIPKSVRTTKVIKKEKSQQQQQRDESRRHFFDLMCGFESTDDDDDHDDHRRRHPHARPPKFPADTSVAFRLPVGGRGQHLSDEGRHRHRRRRIVFAVARHSRQFPLALNENQEEAK